MSLFFPAGILAAVCVESVLLGTILLFLAAKLWKTPEVSLWRALGLCLSLAMIGVVCTVAFRLATLGTDNSAAILAITLTMLVVAFALQWATAKKLLRTNRLRALAVWLSAWVPLWGTELALLAVMRFFFIETYVMPTGGMAPNVIGVHADMECPNCGCKFPVSLSDWQRQGDFRRAREELDAVCVNCREPLRIETTAEMLRGDRFILDKTGAPGRWSMVAFRKPPERTEIFLQRLVGLGGEHIELAGGEVFIDGKLLRKEPYIATDLWIPLHDTDRVPKSMHDGTPRWRPRDEKSGWHRLGSGWAVEAAGDEPQSLVFDGAITNALAYNPAWGSSQYVREHVLGDILVSCTIGSIAGVGSIRFDWAFGNSTASAEISVSGEVVIQAATSGHERARAMGHLPGPLSDGDLLAFAVRDGQAYVLNDGSLAELATLGPDDVESFAPSDENSTANCELALSAARTSLVLDRIVVHRDVYYVGAEEVRAGSLMAISDDWTLEAGEWFMMGDNSARSYDSRYFGPVQTSDLIGVARWIYWPPERWHEMQ